MSPASSTPKKEKILIIEGDASFGDKLTEALKRDGYAVTLVKNGKDGMESILSLLPHLVLLGLVLPGADAYEILEKKSVEPMLAKIPVFLMSTQSVPINIGRVPHGAVAEFIVSMSINVQEVVDKVNEHFGHEEETTAPAASVGMKKKILWVEDDKLIGTILGKKLISSGFDLIHAKNGEDALKALKDTTPDAIVLDLLLPGMSGFDILQKVKMDDKTKKIPSMILSNLSKPSDLEKAKMLGANKFLVKAAASLEQIVGEIQELCK